MSPEVYMCYLINVRHGDFKRLIDEWNGEFKTHNELSARSWKNKMMNIRRTHKSSDWSSFNVSLLFDFINNHLYQGKDE